MSLNLFGRRRGKGEILKAERMLVRIEVIDNPNQSLPAEYNEGNSVDTRLKREWREYYVVARAPHDEHKHIVLHIHKSRVHFFSLARTTECVSAFSALSSIDRLVERD